jgi:hypothetical protein
MRHQGVELLFFSSTRHLTLSLPLFFFNFSPLRQVHLGVAADLNLPLFIFYLFIALYAIISFQLSL